MTVVPMDAERLLSNQMVVVQGGRIVTPGPVAKVSVLVGAMRIDGRGKYLMPGLTDMHWHDDVKRYEEHRTSWKSSAGLC
jgi:imidazolonepropionase-like amidohydrolase